MCVAMTIVDAMLWNVKTQKMTPFEVMTTFEGIVFQGVSCDRFLRRTHAPRTSRSRFARTRVRTPILWWSHFAPAPVPFEG